MPNDTRERQRQIEVASAVIPFVSLAVATALAFFVGGGRRYHEEVLGLTALAVVWMLTMRVPYRCRDEQKARALIYYAGLLLLIGVMIWVDPFFAIFGFTGYLHVGLVPGFWKIPGMVINASMMAVSEVGGAQQLHGRSWFAFAGLAMVNIFIVGAMTKASLDEEARAEQRSRTIDELSEANRRLEQMMEENAGLHAQLVAQAREAGVFDERQRMAGEIHDTLAQGLTGIIAQLEAAELAVDDVAQRGRHLGLAKELARDSLAEARRSVQALRPTALEEARLPEALADLAQQWTRTSGIPVRAEVDGEAVALQPALEVVLFRAAQEALANVAKHSEATKVGMTLTYMHDLVSLDVLDDGAGFDPSTCKTASVEFAGADSPQVAQVGDAGGGSVVPPGKGDTSAANMSGYGLSAMRRRLRQVGGSLAIESAPGDGTTVSASVPALYRSGE